MSNLDERLLKNPAEAFCVDFYMNGNASEYFEWQLHEGLYRLSNENDSNFGGLEGIQHFFKNTKHILVVNTGYIYCPYLSRQLSPFSSLIQKKLH